MSAAAGPVVAAACVLPAGGLEGVDGIDDSKRLSEKRREELAGGQLARLVYYGWAAFEGAFRFETFRSLVSARARFKDVGLAHFFDAAEGSVAAADEVAEAED